MTYSHYGIKLILLKCNELIVIFCYFRYGEHLNRGSFTTMNRSTALDLLDWAHRSQNIEDGSDNWNDTSGVGSLEYHECEGDYTTVWKRGYSVLFDILMVLRCFYVSIIYRFFFFTDNISSDFPSRKISPSQATG